MWNTSWNHKGFYSEVISKMSTEKSHGSIFLWQVTLFFITTPSEVKGIPQIYNNFTGEHPCTSACDLNRVTRQFYWSKTSAWVLSCKLATYLQTIHIYICIYAYTTCIFCGVLLIFGIRKICFSHSYQRSFADKRSVLAYTLKFLFFLKGCVCYIFASLFCMSRRQHLWNKEKCFLFHFESSFRSWGKKL